METRSEHPYSLHSEDECDRLELQAKVARVLDAGSGSGAMARMLAKRHPGAHMTGLDVHPEYVAYARAHAAANGLPNITFEQGDLQAMPFAAASFDSVWSKYVLYFLPRRGDAVRELRWVARPGGAVTVAPNYMPCMHQYPIDRALQAALDLAIPALADIRLVDRLPLMFLEAGFRDVTVQIEADRLYTHVGPISAAQRRNVEALLRGGRAAVSRALGSDAAADAFVRNYPAYLDRPDTCTYTTLWFVRGRAPMV
ncbi:MAG: methyltransferase domain-containing protein [Rhodospirillales bacterium]|nr:methyltransferase domain-containing protein [Rhodospirillales bacterium]